MRKKDRTVKIGIIGDFDANRTSHLATNAAIEHAAAGLSVEPEVSWIPTPSLPHEAGLRKLNEYNGIWASPGTYQSMEGALKGIELARQMDRPFIGT